MQDRLLTIWKGMRNRCRDITNPHYGRKGIRICKDWHSFEKFKKWALENGYESHLTIDRKDSRKGYRPDNCRWITKSENSSLAARKKSVEKTERIKKKVRKRTAKRRLGLSEYLAQN